MNSPQPMSQSPAASEEIYIKNSYSKIMIIDDEIITMEIMKIFLEDNSYQNFKLVEDPRLAIQELNSFIPDIILLDLMMPHIDGFTLLKQIRDITQFKFTPIIILTASTNSEDKIKALSLGATDFLSKPVDKSELSLRIRNTLTAKSYQDLLKYNDPITTLPNREQFKKDFPIHQKMADENQYKFAIITTELDDFKKIRDTISYEASDKSLHDISDRLKKLITTDSILEVYSFGDGLFCLIAKFNKNQSEILSTINHILELTSFPINFQEERLYLTCSIGYSICPDESRETSELLCLSTSAKDYVLKHGGNGFQSSSKEINKFNNTRAKVERYLREALINDEFQLNFQPLAKTTSHEIIGSEALLSWYNADLGQIPTEFFIDVAEETGLIIPIGRWVLKKAIESLSLLKDNHNIITQISINISSKQFFDETFVSYATSICEKYQVDPKLIRLEITESIFVNDIEKIVIMLNQLRQSGFKISIDDFGTGFSSMNYLIRLPIDELKIDKSFMKDISSNKNRAIISSIIYLTRQLNLELVVEGVETQEQLDYLRTEKCDVYQGFFLSKAVPLHELIKLYDKYNHPYELQKNITFQSNNNIQDSFND